MNFQARLGVFPKHHHEYFARLSFFLDILFYHFADAIESDVISVIHVSFLHHLKYILDGDWSIIV